MCERFIKFIPCEESYYLRKNHPNAFLLLSYIAERARRVSGNPDGLEIGCAYIGDYKEAGIETERKYRTAKKILELRSHLKIVETCRNRKKSTTGSTTVGTLVKILRSDVWDINAEDCDDLNVDRETTGRRPSDDEQERKRKNKNIEIKEKNNKKEKIPNEAQSGPLIEFEKVNSQELSTSDNIRSVDGSTLKTSPFSPNNSPKKLKSKPSISLNKEIDKIQFREWVFISQKEYDTLIQKHGSELTERMLDVLDAFNTKNQKNYPSDYGVMKTGGWAYREAIKQISEDKKLAQQNSDKSESTTNQIFAKEIYQKFSSKIKLYNVHLGHNYLEFSPNGGNGIVVHLKFSEKGFKIQVESFLRKCGIVLAA